MNGSSVVPPYYIETEGLDGAIEDPAFLEALAKEVGATVEYQTLSQNSEGSWWWVPGREGGTWREDERHLVRTRARLVTPWTEVDRGVRP